MKRQTPSFDDFPEAFAYCREKRTPVVVEIGGLRHKLYPSGRALVADGGSPVTWRTLGHTNLDGREA